MLNNKKINVLIVDDSILFREVLSRGLSSDPLINIVAMAGNPLEARDMILKHQPDIMICDVQMPKMNGVEFIRQLMPQYPMPVIVISSVSDIAMDAVNAGAAYFVPKPGTSSKSNMEGFIYELISKVKTAAIGESAANVYSRNSQRGADIGNNGRNIIAIGASTGGTEAISSILETLPSAIPGIVIVQHIPPLFSKMFAERLDKLTSFDVREARTGDIVDAGRVLIAPGDQHMRIKKHGNSYRVDCFAGPKVNGHCPSVDVLFESVAHTAGDKAIGIILTGMGRDGARGLAAMNKKGAYTIGQDEASSVVYGMPKAAYEMGGVIKRASLCDIPKLILTNI